jgi:hypothetical protein
MPTTLAILLILSTANAAPTLAQPAPVDVAAARSSLAANSGDTILISRCEPLRWLTFSPLYLICSAMLDQALRPGFGMGSAPPYPFYFLKIPPFISNRRGGHDRDAEGGMALSNGSGFCGFLRWCDGIAAATESRWHGVSTAHPAVSTCGRLTGRRALC